MHSFAQTILELQHQLGALGYSVADRAAVRDAYELSLSLFAGRYQPSGKCFIPHGVGTASILASIGLPAAVVKAGLLHNAYMNGDFGRSGRGISRFKRRSLTQVVGPETEGYIRGFNTLPWNDRSIPRILDGVKSLGTEDRYVLLIRLADQLEHNLDLGPLYCNNPEKPREFFGRTGPMMIAMAEKLNFPSLTTELVGAFRNTATQDIPKEIRTPFPWQCSTVIVPRSFRRRARRVLYGIFVRPLGRIVPALKHCKRVLLGRSPTAPGS